MKPDMTAPIRPSQHPRKQNKHANSETDRRAKQIPSTKQKPVKISRGTGEERMRTHIFVLGGLESIKNLGS